MSWPAKIFLRLLGEYDVTLVKVKSWRPVIANGYFMWPCVLLDSYGGNRKTVWPIWDRARLKAIWRGSD